MIKSKRDYKETTSYEKTIYLKNGAVRAYLSRSKDWGIYKYLRELRKEEYYGNYLTTIWNKVRFLFVKRSKNKLG